MEWLPAVQTILVVWGIIVLYGLFLAITKRATVYRNFMDAGLTFFVFFSLAVGLIYTLLSKTEIFGPAVLIVSACCGVVVVISTLVDNKNQLYAIVALITKLTCSCLFVILAIGVLFPGGNTIDEQIAERAKSLVWLGVLIPIIYLLIRDKDSRTVPTLDRWTRRY